MFYCIKIMFQHTKIIFYQDNSHAIINLHAKVKKTALIKLVLRAYINLEALHQKETPLYVFTSYSLREVMVY